MQQLCRWHAVADFAALRQAVTAGILRAASRAIDRHGSFDLVLAGGNTPLGIYAALSQAAADWPRWHVWFGDERCLPLDAPERNSRMAALAWLDHVPIPRGQIHPIPAELGAGAAAAAYANLLAGRRPFDLVLLGLGEDGHTASLFPGRDWGSASDAADVLAVFDAPKPPAERVSLSARRLADAVEVFFIAGGPDKRDALAAWRAGAALPAAAIRPAGGVEVFFSDT
jgi:6-phosphogluconolactonase